VAGSAYTYGYATLGELFGWIIGWDLVLEYAVSAAGVASGWSGTIASLLQDFGINLPARWINTPGTPLSFWHGHWEMTEALRNVADTASLPHAAAWFNLPAFLVVMAVSLLLVRGIKESAAFNAVIVVLKVATVLIFIGIVAVFLFHPPEARAANWHPFIPANSGAFGSFGWSGIARGAGVIFFAYIGFDSVSTAAQEAKNPQRDMPIGILGSLAICTAIYILISYCAVGSWDFHEFAGSREPLAFILRSLDHAAAAQLIGIAAVVALPSVILVMMYGQTRVLFVMSRDGLLPGKLSQLSGSHTPVFVTVLTGGFVAAIAGFFKLDEIAELSNAGTLLAFLLVAVCVMVLRVTKPALERKFRCPWVWIVAPIAAAGSLYFIISLPNLTILRFVGWNIVGVLVYLAYGRTRANLAKGVD
jgi:APA family basic amino acid/polyamine antiporter